MGITVTKHRLKYQHTRVDVGRCGKGNYAIKIQSVSSLTAAAVRTVPLSPDQPK